MIAISHNLQLSPPASVLEMVFPRFCGRKLFYKETCPAVGG